MGMDCVALGAPRLLLHPWPIWGQFLKLYNITCLELLCVVFLIYFCYFPLYIGVNNAPARYFLVHIDLVQRTALLCAPTIIGLVQSLAALSLLMKILYKTKYKHLPSHAHPRNLLFLTNLKKSLIQMLRQMDDQYQHLGGQVMERRSLFLELGQELDKAPHGQQVLWMVRKWNNG